MDRSQKEELVKTLKSALHNASAVVVTRQTGLTVAEVTDLRRAVKSGGASLKVVKNNLARLAVKDTPYEELVQFLTGPTVLAYSADPVAAAKAVAKFAESNEKFSIVGGMMGEKVLNAAAVESLAKLPSLDELRGRLVGVIAAPATKVARLLREPGACIARVINAHVS